MSICLCDNCFYNGEDNTCTWYHEKIQENDVLDSCDAYDPVEDMQECTWCHEMCPESDMKYERDLGWLCMYCIQAIESRGEKLNFEEYF